MALAHLLLMAGLLHLRPDPMDRPVALKLGVRIIDAPHTPQDQPEVVPPKPLPRQEPPPRTRDDTPPPPPEPPAPEPTQLVAPDIVNPDARPQFAGVVVTQPAPVPAVVIAAAPADPPAAPAAALAPAPAELVLARFDADYLNNPAPVFPLTSRAMREHGTVWLLVQVSAGGDAMEVSLHGSSGYRRLDESALDAVRRWRFVPARRGELAVPCAVLVPIVFNMPR